jgi:hypothetical protein
MNKVTTYTLPTFIDLEFLPITIKHSKLPPFCSFEGDTYTFNPLIHQGIFEVVGSLSDSLGEERIFSFKVEV